MDVEAREARRRRFAANVGPHKPVGKIRRVDVPAAKGVGAHRDALVNTACGKEVATTLVTHRDDRVRCPNCLTVMADH